MGFRTSRALLFVVLLFAGCAGAPPMQPSRVTVPGAWIDDGATHSGGEVRWHTTCFRMPFDERGRAVWARDLLLADRVLAPILAQHRDQIALWRFHRRAAHDSAGHQFSVLLYTDDTVYAAIAARIDADPLLVRLRDSGEIKSVQHGCRARESRPELGATSDPHWDPAVQRSWPYFIMGVSASWLALIRDLGAAMSAGASDADRDSVAYYAAIDARLSELWATQGQHAYLHHLSGIYGYRPLRIQTWMAY